MQEITAMDVQTDPSNSGNSGCCSVAYVGDKDGDLQECKKDLLWQPELASCHAAI